MEGYNVGFLKGAAIVSDRSKIASDEGSGPVLSCDSFEGNSDGNYQVSTLFLLW